MSVVEPSTIPVAPFLDERKALACVHCGLCLGSCPTYLETGNENESPRGRIHLMKGIQSGRLPLSAANIRHLDLCLGCRACETACPSGVQYGSLLETTRDHIERHHRRGPYETFLRRFVVEQVFPRPNLMEWAITPALLLKRTGLAQWLPGWVAASFDLLPEDCSSLRLPEFSPSGQRPSRGVVGFLQGCVMPVMFGDTNGNTVRLLNHAGYDVVTPRAQVCCGALHAHSGRLDQARKSARANVEAFARHHVEFIVTNAAGCGSTLKEYGQLLAEDPDSAEQAEGFASRVLDLSQFLCHVGFEEQLKPSQARNAPTTFHDACHLAHAQGVTLEPRRLVKAAAGPAWVELPEADVCCGSAGVYNLLESTMAARLGERKARHIQSTGAATVVTTNPGCILQMRKHLQSSGFDGSRVVHLADFLAEHLDLAR